MVDSDYLFDSLDVSYRHMVCPEASMPMSELRERYEHLYYKELLDHLGRMVNKVVGFFDEEVYGEAIRIMMERFERYMFDPERGDISSFLYYVCLRARDVVNRRREKDDKLLRALSEVMSSRGEEDSDGVVYLYLPQVKIPLEYLPPYRELVRMAIYALLRVAGEIEAISGGKTRTIAAHTLREYARVLSLGGDIPGFRSERIVNMVSNRMGERMTTHRIGRALDYTGAVSQVRELMVRLINEYVERRRNGNDTQQKWTWECAWEEGEGMPQMRLPGL